MSRYFVRVTISRRIADVTKEKDVWVHSYRMPPDSNNSIKMEVGIEDCLHIEFEYNKSKYVFASAVTAISLIWAQIPPEGCYRRQDLFLVGANQDQAHGTLDHTSRDDGFTAESIQRERDYHEVRDHGWCTSTRYTICLLFCSFQAHNLLVGETIPIRLFLGGFDLTPTFREVNKKFSVRYYLNLVLIDEENRRYFKQQVRTTSPRVCGC